VIFVKVDGNRRITLFKRDEAEVWAIFTDLLIERELKELMAVDDSLGIQENINSSEETFDILE